MRIKNICRGLSCLILALVGLAAMRQEAFTQATKATISGTAKANAENISAVNFTTDDGWKIFGTLYLPETVISPVPGVVLLTEPGWVDRSIYDNYLSRKLAKSGRSEERRVGKECRL